MKLAIAAVVLCCSMSIMAQNTQPVAVPPTPPQTNMHQQHMQDMKAHIAKMRENVTQMRTNAAKIKDPALRQQAQLDADMWDGMIAHMESMQGMMGGPGGMGMMAGGPGMTHGGPGGMGMMHDGMGMM